MAKPRHKAPPARISRTERRTRERVNPTIAAAIRRYQRLLDTNASEEVIRTFLANHLYFWNGLLRFGNTLWTKIGLGAEYEIDFVFCDPGSSGAEWHLVEIEPPSFRLFTAKGDPSKELTHALRQVRDWQRWLQVNRAYGERLMPGIDSPMGHVFIGRRSELTTSEARERLKAINVQNRAHVEIHTLDRFTAMALTTLTDPYIERYQPRALSDKELRAGIPNDLLHYIRSGFGRRKDFIKDRRFVDSFDEDIGDDPEGLRRALSARTPPKIPRRKSR